MLRRDGMSINGARELLRSRTSHLLEVASLVTKATGGSDPNLVIAPLLHDAIEDQEVRYTHAHQFKRARRELKFLRTRLGRIIRDIRRKIEGDPALEDRFGPLLDLAHRVRHQEQRQRGPEVYSLHAPEVECIGKGKAGAPYEFGCKVSIATPATASKGGQFVLHAKV